MQNKRVNVYLAGSMFCEADRMYNELLAKKLRERCGESIDLYVPQENLSINDKTKCADSHAIFWGDYNRLQNTDIFIARIDGDIPPSGTSAEIGIMSQRRQYWESEFKTMQMSEENTSHTKEELYDQFVQCRGYEPMIVGLCTDSRNPKRTYLEAKNELMKDKDYESQYCYFNLFTIGCIKVNGQLTTSIDELVNAVGKIVDTRVGKRTIKSERFLGSYWDPERGTFSAWKLISYNDGTEEAIRVE